MNYKNFHLKMHEDSICFCAPVYMCTHTHSHIYTHTHKDREQRDNLRILGLPKEENSYKTGNTDKLENKFLELREEIERFYYIMRQNK